MDIKKLPTVQQQQWLEQRGWRQGKPGMWVDPDSRVSYYFGIALDHAIADCRIDSDMELKPIDPGRKDDSPPPATGSGPHK